LHGQHHRGPHALDLLLGGSDEAIWEISRENPIEMIDRCCLRNGELSMYIAYGGHDELNVDAQVESFLYMAKFRRIGVAVGYDPAGRHKLQTLYQLWPGIVSWLAVQLAPYSATPPLATVAVPQAVIPSPVEAHPIAVPQPALPPTCPSGNCPGSAHAPSASSWDGFVGPLHATAGRPALPARLQ
jgi:hypothetical protein